MREERLDDLSGEEQGWIEAYLDGTIDAAGFEALQDRMLESAALRAVMRRYLALDGALQAEAGPAERAGAAWVAVDAKPEPKSENVVVDSGWWQRSTGFAVAAALVVFLAALVLVRQNAGPIPDVGGEVSGARESMAEGFAVVTQLFDPVWPAGGRATGVGEMLGAERFELLGGTAEIQFFSGATMTVEGPAEISLKSAWEASCQEGTIRMRVPPAARGFRLRGPATEIVDLGTEFGLEVREGKGHVEVFDGEIAVRHRGEAERLVASGQAWSLPAGSVPEAAAIGEVSFPDLGSLGLRAASQQRTDFARWEAHREGLARDPRLIAYYTFDRTEGGSLIRNATVPGNAGFDGTVVLAEPVDGRWPGLKPALEFRRPGARVRVNLAGEFLAFTFVCWVRIDSLDRQYNALFMADGYETGEPHWQIREDGKMMLSVMVDDTRPNPVSEHDAGFHRVYYSPPMWDRSMSGGWLHLASVFDPAGRAVSHYVNGARISRAEIEDEYLIETLRIGNGEIGNWGLPFREDPRFAIRNLNGRMDELAIFRVALGDGEIGRLYESSRAERR